MLIRRLISACLKQVVKLDGLALSVPYSFRFDFVTFGNSYGRLIRRKGLLIPFFSISFFFSRSNRLTEDDLKNRKTAFHKILTFSAASVRALVRPRASSYRFFLPFQHPEEGYSLEFLVGVCRPHLQIQTQFQTQKMRVFATDRCYLLLPQIKFVNQFTSVTSNSTA